MFEHMIPTGNKLIVKRADVEERSAGGLYMPSESKDKPQWGTVIAVGPGNRDSLGVVHPIEITIGSTVYFGKYAGVEVGPYIAIKEDEILCVIANL